MRFEDIKGKVKKKMKVRREKKGPGWSEREEKHERR